jgi:hypothetical protein
VTLRELHGDVEAVAAKGDESFHRVAVDSYGAICAVARACGVDLEDS